MVKLCQVDEKQTSTENVFIEGMARTAEEQAAAKAEVAAKAEAAAQAEAAAEEVPARYCSC